MDKMKGNPIKRVSFFSYYTFTYEPSITSNTFFVVTTEAGKRITMEKKISKRNKKTHMGQGFLS
jgi:hypothetical protein